MKITHPIPSDVPTSLMVYCRLDPMRLPTPEDIVCLAENWIDRNVAPPLSALMPPWLHLPMTKMGPVPVSGLPHLVLNRHRSNLTDPAHRAAMDQANYAIMIRSEGPCIPGLPGLLPCVAAAFGCLEQYGGVIVDADTNSPMLPRPFADLSFDMLPRLHCFVDVAAVAGANGGTDIVTVGMNRFGVPELVMEDVPLSIDEQCAKIVLGVGQLVATLALQYGRDKLSEQYALHFPLELSLTTDYMQIANGDPVGGPSAGAGSDAPVRVEFSQQSPAHPPFLKVVPAEGWPSSKAAWANGLVSTFFAPLPPTGGLWMHDDDMEAGHRRAVAELPSAKRRYLAGETLPDMFIVKYPFPVEDGRHEYMWISVRNWTGDRITGALGNQPNLRKDLSMGDIVTVDAADVFDWMIVGPDGVLGGYTDATPVVSEARSSEYDDLGIADMPKGLDVEEPDFVRRRKDPRFLGQLVPGGRSAALSMLPAYQRVVSRPKVFLKLPITVLVISALLFHWPILTILGAAFGIYKLRAALGILNNSRGMALGLKDVAERGEYRVGLPIMFNTALKQPGRFSAPALLLMMPADDSDPVQLYDRIMAAAARKEPR